MKTCCFIGHRNVKASPELFIKLKNVIKTLIETQGVQVFLFGSASSFDDLCYEAVTEIKKQYPSIKRIYVRSHFAYVTQSYIDYLLKSYEDTLIPERVETAGIASYVERNQEMINSSDFCVFYYDEHYAPPMRKRSRNSLFYQPKSGTRLAYEYANQKKKNVINLFNFD